MVEAVARVMAVDRAYQQGDADGAGKVAAKIDGNAEVTAVEAAGHAALDGEPDGADWVTAARVEVKRDTPPAETRVRREPARMGGSKAELEPEAAVGSRQDVGVDPSPYSKDPLEVTA